MPVRLSDREIKALRASEPPRRKPSRRQRQGYGPYGAPHPFGLPLIALAVAGIFGLAYGLFGIGETALYYALAATMVYATPVIVIFGITGLAWILRWGLRRLRGSAT
jgi:hypothetical protein